MTPNLYKFYLLDYLGNYYYIDNGDLRTTSTKTALKSSPKEWEQMRISFGRDPDGYGINTSISDTFTFYGDTRTILQNIIYEGDGQQYDAYCRIIIEKRYDGGSSVWAYNTWFDGRVDLVTFEDYLKDNNNDVYCSVRCYENNAMQKFAANSEKEYQIPIGNKIINIEGNDLLADYNWEVGALSQVSFIGFGSSAAQAYVVPMGLVQLDTTDYFRNIIYVRTQGHSTGVIGAAIPNLEDAQFLTSAVPFTGTLSVTLDFSYSSDNTPTQYYCMLIEQRVSDNSISNYPTMVHTFYDSGITSSSGTISFTASTSYNFKGDNYRYFVAITANGTNANRATVNSGSMSLTFSKALPPTDCAAMKYYEYGQALVNRVFGGDLTFKSDFLTNTQITGDDIYKYYNLLPSSVMITSGDAIRQIASPSIKGSLLDFLRDCYVEHMCGWCIEGNYFRIEPLNYFLQRNIKIATINGATISDAKVAKEMLFNRVKVGNPPFKANDLNGRYEWNSQQEWEILNLNAVVETKELITPYKSSMYEIEFLRSSVFGEETKDTDNDNSIYKLDCLPNTTDNKYTLRKYQFTGGLPNPDTVYNLAFSPRRKLQRHIPELKSVMNILDAENNTVKGLYNISFDRYTGFYTYIQGVYNYEFSPLFPANVPIKFQQKKLYIPRVMEFEFVPQENIIQKIKDNPYGYFEILVNGKTYNVFLWQCEITGSETDTIKLTGLFTPFNTTQNMISS